MNDTSHLDIMDDDIMYEDSLIRILRPDAKKGVLLFSSYRTRGGKDNIKEIGLKTGKLLQQEGYDLGYTSVFHQYIFFRAPWFSRKIDYATHETEISSSFGRGHMDINNRCFIRVDPDKTFVFSSCIREHFETNYNYVGNVDAELDKSKKTLSEYLKILEYNAELYKTVYPIFVTKTQPAYDLYTSKLIVFPNNGNFIHTLEYPLSTSPIDMNSEVLVALQHLTPDYFVRCT